MRKFYKKKEPAVKGEVKKYNHKSGTYEMLKIHNLKHIPLFDTIEYYLNRNQKLQAVKETRDLTGFDLMSCKEIVEGHTVIKKYNWDKALAIIRHKKLKICLDTKR